MSNQSYSTQKDGGYNVDDLFGFGPPKASLQQPSRDFGAVAPTSRFLRESVITRDSRLRRKLFFAYEETRRATEELSMPRTGSAEGKITPIPEATKVRLTLDLSQRLNAEVERIAHDQGTTKAEVLRSAIEFLRAATEARKAGMSVGAWREEPNGVRREREFIGL